MHLFSLFLRWVAAPTPPTIALLLSLQLLLRFSKLCLTPTSSNISNLTIFFQITSMASVRQDLQGIFFPILLMSGHPLLGTSAPFLVSSGVPQGSVLSPTLFLLFIYLLHATASDVHSFANDSNLHKSSSFQCQPSSNARSQSCLAMSSTINSDLQSISEWGTRNLVKFNTSKTQLLTISLSNTPSNYPIIFEDNEIPPLNSINILGLQISSSLSWRDHIVQIAKAASKKLGVLFRCKQYFNLLIIQTVYWFYSSLLGILLSYLGFFPLYFSS